ncbi:MAG: hypothetical protein AB2L20_07495 [Mangrovibacterium sp.]
MTWNSFTIVVAVCYALYYGGNILFDLIRPAPVAKDGEQTEVLRFTEETAPVIVKGPENDDEPVTPGITKRISPKETTESRETSPQKGIHPDPLSGGLSISRLLPAIRQKAVVMTTKHDFERSNYGVS